MFTVLFSVVAYATFLCTFLYTIPFVAGFGVPRTLDGPGAWTVLQGLPVNAGLLALFAVQHSVMARPAFKRVWTRVCPAQAERSFYVLASCLVLVALFVFWRPIPGEVWELRHPAAAGAAWVASALGWAVVLLSTFMISHADLFGLRQAFLSFRDRTYASPPFQAQWFYRVVRHPLMFGFLLAFWATPHMTVGHLFFALMTTTYVLVAIQLEERDLVAHLGESYRNYQAQVPMLIPLGRRNNQGIPNRGMPE